MRRFTIAKRDDAAATANFKKDDIIRRWLAPVDRAAGHRESSGLKEHRAGKRKEFRARVIRELLSLSLSLVLLPLCYFLVIGGRMKKDIQQREYKIAVSFFFYIN